MNETLFYNIIGFGGRVLPAPVAKLDRCQSADDASRRKEGSVV